MYVCWGGDIRSKGYRLLSLTDELRTALKPYTELQRALRQYTVKAKPTGRLLGSGTYGRVIELLLAGEIVAGKVFRTSLTIHGGN